MDHSSYKGPVYGAIFILIVFFLLISPFGFSVNDGGFMNGLGWRVLSGESIYKDFIYARPPLSVEINALLQYLLPNKGEGLFIRWFFYVEVMTYSTLSFLIIKKFVNLSQIEAFLYVLLFSLINAHFIFFHWHTVDGVLLLTIGLYLLLNHKMFFTAGVFFGLGMMTKQSFYPIILIAPFFLLLTDKNSSVFKNIMGIFVSIATVFGLTEYFMPGSVSAYLELHQLQSQIWPLIDSAIFTYACRFAIFVVLSLLSVSALEYKVLPEILKEKEYRRLTLIFLKHASIMIFIFVIVGFLSHPFKATENFAQLILHTGVSAGLVIALLIVILGKENSEQKFTFILLLSIGWMSSISWGYKTPIFFSGVIFFILFQNLKTTNIRIFFQTVFVLVIIVSVTLLKIPESENRKSLGIFSEKMAFLFASNQLDFDNIENIFKKIKGCKSYVVVPSHTYIHWANESQSPVPLDWISNVEMMNKEHDVQMALSKADCIVEEKHPLFDKLDTKYGWSGLHF